MACNIPGAIASYNAGRMKHRLSHSPTEFPGMGAGTARIWQRVIRALGILLVAALGSQFPSAKAATIVVTNTSDTDPGSLRQAILDATAGDTDGVPNPSDRSVGY